MKKRLIALLMLLLSSYCQAKQPDNPFGHNVFVFDASSKEEDINRILMRIYEQQRLNEFGEQRFAILFMPGIYGSTVNIDIRTGYYTQVLGLGESPDATVIIGALRTQDWPFPSLYDRENSIGSSQNYWRGAENFSLLPTLGSLTAPGLLPLSTAVWAVGKASYLRRMHIKGALRLYDLGLSGGGFIANSLIDTSIDSSKQLTGFIRNSVFTQWIGSNLSTVFVGDAGGIPGKKWPHPAYTIIDKIPLIREKPYLIYDQQRHNYFIKTGPLKKNRVAVDWHELSHEIPLQQCFIAHPGDDSKKLNAILADYRCLIFTPGVYQLEDTLRVVNFNTIIYGLGFPSLINKNGLPVMILADVDGIELAGLIFDAGPYYSSSLLQIGSLEERIRHSKNPISLHDIYCRVGGLVNSGQSQSCLEINSHDVLIDNLWLWRADYGFNVGWFINKAKNGLVVNGEYVLIYDLIVDNFQQFQTLWQANYGQVYGYSSLAPTDVPSQQDWQNEGVDGFSSYKIKEEVFDHRVFGLSIFSFFDNADNLYLQNAIESPTIAKVQLKNMLIYWFGGHYNTGIRHIINERGREVGPVNKESTLEYWP